MTIDELANKSVGILGFGQEGQAVFNYLRKHNIIPKIFDEVPQEQWTDEAKTLAAQSPAGILAGPNSFEKITECEVLFRSPGIWRNHPQILIAEENGVIITSQTKWFFDNCPGKIIGVTGTKGKGTTCSLIYNIFKEAQASVYLTGNIGKLQPLEFLDQTTSEDWIVYELSSFQLQDLTVSPHIGVCLMVTSDHLNHHSNLGEYHSAKAAITAFQKQNDISIFNSDYEASEKIGSIGIGEKLEISGTRKPNAGAYIHQETIELVSGQGHNPVIISCENRKLRGKHNLENIAAACLAGMKTGIPTDLISKVVNNFAGLEHRLQFIGSFHGVAYYNDSISTVPETAIAAVKSFNEPVHLFLGGSEKGLDYSSLIESLKRANLSSIILLGEVGKKLQPDLAQALPNAPLFGPYTDFDLAIKETVANARAGEIVLLSPASASFDMFNNYKQRGEQFVTLVNKYAS